MNYYICTGENPRKYESLGKKVGNPLSCHKIVKIFYFIFFFTNCKVESRSTSIKIVTTYVTNWIKIWLVTWVKVVRISWNFVRFQEILNQKDAKNYSFLSSQTK